MKIFLSEIPEPLELVIILSAKLYKNTLRNKTIDDWILFSE